MNGYLIEIIGGVAGEMNMARSGRPLSAQPSFVVLINKQSPMINILLRLINLWISS